MLQRQWSWKTLCQVKETVTKAHMLYDSVYMKYPEYINPELWITRLLVSSSTSSLPLSIYIPSFSHIGDYS